MLLPKLVMALSPDTPVDLHATAEESPVVARLTWSAAPGSAPIGYRVYAGIGADGPYVKSYETTLPAFDFVDGLGGIEYYFRVTAISASGDESDYAQGGPVKAGWAATPHASATATSTTCPLCHTEHQAALTGTLARQELATSSPDPSGICYQCHDGRVASAANITTGSVDSFSLPSGHQLGGRQSGSLVATCESCHEVHASAASSPMLPAKKVNGVSVTSDGPEWCEACHDSKDSWYGPNYPSTSTPSRDSSGYPTAGTWPGPTTYSSGFNAHRLIAETTQTVETRAKFKRSEGDCRYCHAAHGGPNKYDGLVAMFRPSSPSTLASDQADGTYGALCFTCHGGVTPRGFTTAPADIKRFATAGNDSAGHRVVTPGGTLPVGASLPCYDCHNPHGSSRGNASMISDERGAGLETSSAAGVRRFCFTCHTTGDNKTGWDSVSATYTSVGADDVEGIARTGGVLKLPLLAGHREADTTSCYTCHGDGYGVGGRNVHDPGVASVDATAPLTVADAQPVYSNAATITLTAADDVGGSGVASTHYILDAGAETTGTVVTVSTPGFHMLEFWSTDAAGNSESPHDSVTFTVIGADTTAPVTTSDALAAYTDSATIALTATDDSGGSGVAATYYKVDGGAQSTGTTITVSTAGSHTLEFWSVDVAGNVEAPHDFVTFTVIDSIAPTTTSDALATYTDSATIQLTATDNVGGSGVADTFWQLDTTFGSWTGGTFVTVAAPSSGSASHTLYFYSRDAAGNEEATQSVSFTIVTPDTNPPTGTIDIDSGASFTATVSVTLNLSASDTGGSGLSQMRFSDDGSTWSAWESYAPSKGWTVPSGDGSKTVWVQYRDGALNLSTGTISDTIVLDTTAPTGGTVNINSGSAATSQTAVTLALFAADSGSGLHQMRFSNDNSTWSDWQAYSTSASWTLATGDGAKTVYAQFKDNADNVTSTAISHTIVLDTQGPAVTIGSPANGMWLGDGSTVISGAASDAGSGVSVVQIIIARSDGTYWTGTGWAVAPTWVTASGTTSWNYTWQLPANENGTYTYSVNGQATDVARNAGTSVGVSNLRVDNVAPTGTMSVNNDSADTTSTAAIVNSSVTDAGSGVTSMSVDPGTGTYGSWVAYSASYGITLPVGDGTKTVRVQCRDAVGNVTTISDTIVLDTTAPTGTMSVNGGSIA
ncbi:MAG TPA: cytochrome c3 family protein, partial [Coriobacteriia bacterium]